MTLRKLLEEINKEFTFVMNFILDVELSAICWITFYVLFFFFCVWVDKKWNKASEKADENIKKKGTY